jgi:hypothetical protein
MKERSWIIEKAGDRVYGLQKYLMSEISCAFLTVLENPRERFIRTAG